MEMQDFSQYTQYFLEANSTDITGEDLNYDLLKIIKNELFRYFHGPYPDSK